ncbi:MAG: ABC transporter ATP-binding protein [Spirochaetales bacterium]|nr:ABC transporter ATP-binding protein [Spirochaetales bacterium]
MDTILKLDMVNKNYGDFSLMDVSFSLEKGFVMGFIGKNGAGKTTTLNCIIGISNYDSGEIEILGANNKSAAFRQMKEKIGYVSEEPFFYENFTVDWTGNFAGRFYRDWNRSLFVEYCRRFDLKRTKKVKELSKGMKTKLGLALALSHKAELLILDEPSSGLDPEARRDLLDILQEVMENNECSILFSSHITADIQKIADYVCMIDNGRIILCEEKDSLLENYHFVQLDKKYRNEELDKYLVGCREIKNGYSALTRDKAVLEKLLKKEDKSARLFAEKPNLDELFLHFTGEDK